MTAPTCRACGSADVTLCGHKRGQFLTQEFAFYRCCRCELLFVEPFSGFAIYDDAYYRGAGPDPYVDYETEYRDWRRTDRGLEFADLARIAENFLRERAASAADGGAAAAPVRWLDFGCGAGGLLKFLRDRGSLAGRKLELTGHDVGSYADLLRTTDGFNILGLDELSRAPDASFDIISMIEVIEHLPQPAEPLRLVSRLLKPGGLLLLTTGNLGAPVARSLGLRYHYCTPEIHISLFNPRSLARLYADVGLIPHAVRYDGTVRFKVVKTLRYRPALRGLARAALSLPPTVRLVDALYGVSAMPCATKPNL